MDVSEVERAVSAAAELASALGLAVDEARIICNSNKLALRLLPCDVFGRVAFVGQEEFRFEIEIARRLTEQGSPVAGLDARVEPPSMSKTGSPSRSGGTTNSRALRLQQSRTRRRLSDCMRAWRNSMSSRRISATESRKLNGLSPAMTKPQGLKSPIESFSVGRCRAAVARLLNDPHASSCCMASRTQGTC